LLFFYSSRRRHTRFSRDCSDVCSSDLADRARGGPGISYLDLFIVIAARALARHPYMNARLEGDDIVVEPDVHIGIAVDHPDGLLVPVIRDVLDLSVGAVARRRAAVVQGARGGT